MRAKSLMVQGTMSGVGKSLLVAGLCRVLAQDGVRVAPFKSQNMALNSAITAEGLEMGRAQVVQAEAPGIEPSAAMNPILLKPTTDMGSQVIVHGKSLGTMAARDYFAFRHTLKDQIMAAYDELASSYDVILVEGAGSPAEVNLKRDDIVNMGLAEMINAPVALVGDIDRGGVFAQLIGTMMLLEEHERRRVKGSIVNKFRGDVTILEPGLDILRAEMGVPVLGVVPYLQLDIDDEDSLSDRLAMRAGVGLVDVAVVRLPKISNFTDFIALEAAEGIGLRYVSRPVELGNPDLIILPGTKSTMDDLRWLRTCGLEAAILRAADRGCAVLGICGGYQMLGELVSDPEGMEGFGELTGMGLLPVRTVFGREKRTVQSEGVFREVGGVLSALSGQPVSGYEIHMGRTERMGAEPLITLGQGGTEGIEDGCQRGSVYGCYLHGLFDHAAVTQALAQALLAAKGLDPSAAQAFDMASYRQHQYDLLADGVRASLDMERVYRIIEEGA